MTDKTVEAVARTICKMSGRCKYLGNKCNTGRCTVKPEEAQAVINTYLEALEVEGKRIISESSFQELITNRTIYEG